MTLIGFALALPMPAGVGVAAGGGGFSPLDLSPTLWLDASDTSTITLGTGSLVTTWADKSGNGYDMTQGTSTYQPDSGTRTLNGLNVLDFDNDNMENATVSTSNQSVVFIVSDDDAITGTARYYVRGLNASVTPIVGVIGGTSYRIFQGTALDQGTAATGVKLWRAVFDTTDTLHVNQVSEISGNAGTNTMTGLRTGSSVGATYGINAALAEIIIVDGTLTAQQISDTETYLTNKWIPIPIQLNATAWFDASNTFSIAESSGSVSQWDDLSGNGYHLAQATGGAQPKTGTATINSLNAIEYDSTLNIQFLQNTTVPIETNGPYTVLMVQEINASDTAVLPLASKVNTGYGFVGDSGSTNTTITNNWSTPSLYVNGTESAVTTRGDVYTAFTNSPALVRQQGILASSSSYNGLRIGYDGGVFNLSHGSKIAELVVLDDPAPADVATAESYLAEKWGVTLQEFSPLDLSPTLWLDASDTSTIIEDPIGSGSVSQWDDKSTNNHDLTQATGTKQPTTGTRTINSLNVIDFDGSSDYMQVTYGSSISQPLTIFAVAQNDDPPAANVLWAGITTLANAQLYLAGTVTAHWINGGDPTLSYSTAPDGNLNIYRVTYNGASTSLAINGDVKITGTTGTHSPTGFTIGASPPGTAPFDGVIGEAVVVEGAMTAQQIYDTEQYLANKWGITL